MLQDAGSGGVFGGAWSSGRATRGCVEGHHASHIQPVRQQVPASSSAPDSECILLIVGCCYCFSFDKWRAVVQCLSVVDVIVSLSRVSRGAEAEMCRPQFVEPSRSTKVCLQLPIFCEEVKFR